VKGGCAEQERLTHLLKPKLRSQPLYARSSSSRTTASPSRHHHNSNTPPHAGRKLASSPYRPPRANHREGVASVRTTLLLHSSLLHRVTTTTPIRLRTPAGNSRRHRTGHHDRDTRAPWKLELRPSPPRPSPLRPKPFILLLARDRPLLPSRDHKTKPILLTAARLCPPEIAINDSGRRRRHTSAHSSQSLPLFFRERERRRDSLNSPPPCRPHRDPVRGRHAITFHRRRASNRRRLFSCFFVFCFDLCWVILVNLRRECLVYCARLVDLW